MIKKILYFILYIFSSIGNYTYAYSLNQNWWTWDNYEVKIDDYFFTINKLTPSYNLGGVNFYKYRGVRGYGYNVNVRWSMYIGFDKKTNTIISHIPIKLIDITSTFLDDSWYNDTAQKWIKRIDDVWDKSFDGYNYDVNVDFIYLSKTDGKYHSIGCKTNICNSNNLQDDYIWNVYLRDDIYGGNTIDWTIKRNISQHEVGHYLGNYDEYAGSNDIDPKYKDRVVTGSVMHNSGSLTTYDYQYDVLKLWKEKILGTIIPVPIPASIFLFPFGLIFLFRKKINI